MNYWIIVDNQPAGPYTGEQLVESGLKPDTLVWRKGYARWIESGLVPELAEMMRLRDLAPAPGVAPAEEPSVTEAAAEEPSETEITSTDTHVETPSYDEEIVEIVSETRREEPTEVKPWEPRREEQRECPPTPGAAAMQQPQPSTSPRGAASDAASPAGEAVPPCPPAYVAWSIIVTILCCTPVGVAAIILSSMTRSAYYRGQLDKSRKYSEITQWLIIASIICGTALAPFQMLVLGMMQ